MILLAETVDPSTFERLGTAGIVAVILLAAIGWLIKDRAAIRAERDAERRRSEAVADRLVQTIERVLPMLDRVERALDRRERDA